MRICGESPEALIEDLVFLAKITQLDIVTRIRVKSVLNESGFDLDSFIQGLEEVEVVAITDPQVLYLS